MKINALVSAALGAIIATSAASAAFTGLSVDRIETYLPVDGSPVLVVRVYADFDDPTDRLLSISVALVTANEPLYQNPLGSSTEPPIGARFSPFPDLAFDSFVTMNRFSNSTLGPWTPATSLEPGAAFSATGFTGGWFTDGDAPQTTGSLSYLLAQLTIENPTPSVFVQGTLTVAWKTAFGGAQFTETSLFATDDGPIPAAGAVPLLTLAIASTGRRRDNQDIASFITDARHRRATSFRDEARVPEGERQ
jgi:hypothetical protein